MNRHSLTRYAWLSIAAAVTTIGLKAGAWAVTGSVGLLSDALESFVNLAAAIFALIMLTVAARPPDDEHAFGHDKAEYFAGGLEGGLILLAAFGIALPAIDRLLHPQEITQIDLGLILSGIASVVNFAVARILLKVGREERSVTLEADGHHLMTDVWTSIGVLVGVGLVALTGLSILDPLIGIVVAFNILFTGVKIIIRAAQGLMDRAIPEEERKNVENIITSYHGEGVRYHALRSRQAGGNSFISFHLLVPGEWSVQKGHDLSEKIEEEIRNVLPSRVSTFIHLEPVEDPVSWEDIELYRSPPEPSE